MEAENNRKTRLQKLSGSNFEIADGQSDIRGWDVKDSAGKKLGEVDELIFDYQSGKVRYMVVDLDENDYELDDKEVLVPIGIAELHESDDDVILPGVTPDQLRVLPEYDEDRFDTQHEGSVRNVFGGLGESALNGGSDKDVDFYSHEHFNDANLYRNRTRGMVEDGSTGTLLPGEASFGTGEVNPGGVRLRSRETNIDGSGEIKPGNPTAADKNDQTGEYAGRRSSDL